MSDAYFPYVFDLSSGNVQEIYTGQADPRVVFDRHGLRATNATGAELIDLNADTGAATFAGKVSAGQGVNLAPADITGLPPAVNAVQWLRADNGGLVASIAGEVDTQNPPNYSPYLALQSKAQTLTDQSTVALEAWGAALGTDNQAKLLVAQQQQGAVAEVLVQTPNQAVILNQANQSNFVQAGNSIAGNQAPITRRLGSACRAHRTTAMNFAANAWATVPVDAVDFDPDGAIRNGGFVAPWGGAFLIFAQVAANSTAANQQLVAGMNKNGVLAAQGSMVVSAAGSNWMSSQVALMVQMNTGDSVETAVFCSTALAASLSNNNNFLCVIPIN